MFVTVSKTVTICVITKSNVTNSS